ncbi:1-phosphofructokinase [Lactiplantibacillus herbarum]|uniref:1-phosphofructokinase n=1 Tax=Lactiplantibacillus herbarum TaxID=1670446 RepID=UPI00064EB43D|nr:1-phosphofructokinase [Lactiplantibacillus herbarum]
MIYTITVNPSIDYVVQLPNMVLGSVNRLAHAAKLPGGKGINVSQILNDLEQPNRALGFIGGFTGTFISDALKQKGLDCHFTPIADDTRINVKIHAEGETELNGAGPDITAAEIDSFYTELADLTPDDVVVMSGSLAPSLPASFYYDIIQKVEAAGANFVIDTTGEALKKTLPSHPLVVKPNNHELADYYQTTFNSQADIIAAGQRLLAEGAQHVLISMAGDGGLLITKDAVYFSPAPKGHVINSVGAGDSMIGGFVGTFAKTHDAVESFRYGLACGSATAFSEDIATRAKIDEILPLINIEQLSD